MTEGLDNGLHFLQDILKDEYLQKIVDEKLYLVQVTREQYLNSINYYISIHILNVKVQVSVMTLLMHGRSLFQSQCTAANAIIYLPCIYSKM